MKKEELNREINHMIDFYKKRREEAEKFEYPGIDKLSEYGDWWYERAVVTFTEMIIKDLQEIINVLEAPF